MFRCSKKKVLMWDVDDGIIANKETLCYEHEVDKIVTRKGVLNCDPLKIILKLKSDSQVVYLKWLS